MGPRLLGPFQARLSVDPRYWADAGISEVEYYPAPPPYVEAGPNIPALRRIRLDTGPLGLAPRPYPGAPVTGRWSSRTGCGSPPTMSAPLALLLVEVTGTTRSAVAASCSRRCISTPAHAHVRPSATLLSRDRPDRVSQPSVRTPKYTHYYFGDYYAPSYRNVGSTRRFRFTSSRHGYDPIYAHHAGRIGKRHEW